MGSRQATYTFTPQAGVKKEGFSAFYHYLALIVLAILFILVGVGGVILYREYTLYLTLRHETATIRQETALLGQKYQAITSKEVVLKKAKKLGLHPPTRDQIVELRLNAK